MSVSLDTLSKANIFFFVTTIAVVLVALTVVAIGYYAVKFLEQGRLALKKVEDHVGDASEELKDILFDIQDSAVYRFLFRRKKRR